MAKRKTVAFDAAEFLDTEEAQAAYIQEACATGDVAFIAKSIGDVARARGMAAIAKEAKVGRESLYKALSGDGNPELGTIIRVLAALNLTLSVEPQAAPAVMRREQTTGGTKQAPRRPPARRAA